MNCEGHVSLSSSVKWEHSISLAVWLWMSKERGELIFPPVIWLQEGAVPNMASRCCQKTSSWNLGVGVGWGEVGWLLLHREDDVSMLDPVGHGGSGRKFSL